LQRPSTLLSIGPPVSPEPDPWKLTERLNSIHSWRLYPLSNGQFGLFKMQLTVSVRTEVIPLGVKLKVACISSIHSWKFTSIACFGQQVIA
jgi:hypothetical protein